MKPDQYEVCLNRAPIYLLRVTICFVFRTTMEEVLLPNRKDNQKPFYIPAGTQ